MTTLVENYNGSIGFEAVIPKTPIRQIHAPEKPGSLLSTPPGENIPIFTNFDQWRSHPWQYWSIFENGTFPRRDALKQL